MGTAEENSSQPVLSGNFLLGNEQAGLYLVEAFVSLMEDNLIGDNPDAGVSVYDRSYEMCILTGGPDCEELPRSEIQTCAHNVLFENGRDFDEWCEEGYCHVISDEIKACFIID